MKHDTCSHYGTIQNGLQKMQGSIKAQHQKTFWLGSSDYDL